MILTRALYLLLIAATHITHLTVQASDTIAIKQVSRPGFASVNSWLLEGAGGIVVIDVQRVISAGNDVVAAIRASEKPLLGVIITHPHPDHFGGLAAILDVYPDTPVYSSAATQKVIAGDLNGYQKATRNVAPEDTPEIFPAPNKAFSNGGTVTLGGITLHINEIGAGESETMTVLYAPTANALFVGDLVAHEMTGFVLERRSANWIQQIDAILAKHSETAPTVYPGHGQAGAFKPLLDGQRQWLVDLHEMTKARLEDGVLTDDEVVAIEAAFSKKYKDYPIVAEIPPLMTLNIRAVGAELLAAH